MSVETAIFSAQKTGGRLYLNLDFLEAWNLFNHLQIMMDFIFRMRVQSAVSLWYLPVLTAKNIEFLKLEILLIIPDRILTFNFPKTILKTPFPVRQKVV